jgi:hypothetical protein
MRVGGGGPSAIAGALLVIGILIGLGAYYLAANLPTKTQTSTQLVPSTSVTTSTSTTTSTSIATSTSVTTSTSTATIERTLETTIETIIVSTSTTLEVNNFVTTTTSTSTTTTSVTVTYTTTGSGVQIVASPTSGAPNENITVVGNGLQPGVGVTLSFGNFPNDVLDVSNVTTRQDGTFSTSFLVPHFPVGPYLLVANASGAHSVSFNVIPSITLSPSSGMPNTQVEITGGGFSANSTVTVDMGALILAQVTTDSHGSFSAMRTIPGSMSQQTYLVTASDSSGYTASANFTVT